MAPDWGEVGQHHWARLAPGAVAGQMEEECLQQVSSAAMVAERGCPGVGQVVGSLVQ